MAGNRLSLELEENHGDGLVERSRVVVGRIGRFGETLELAQADTVGTLEHVERAVVDAGAHDAGLAEGRPGGGAHPGDVVVAPFDVEGVILHQAVQNAVGMGPAVEDIAHEVQAVHGEALDERRERLDEVVGRARLDDGLDDLLVVFLAADPVAGRGV